MKPIQSKYAPEAIGPYSQAILANCFLFCSGQIGLEPKSGKIATGIEAQTKQVLNNLSAVLTEAGVTKKDVVKTTIYLIDLKNFEIVNSIYAAFFENHKPARATVQVSKLPKQALIEIELIAICKTY